MYIALSLVVGAIAVWVMLVGIFLLVGWWRKSLVATLKRLVKYHAGILLVLALLVLDFEPCVTTPLMSTGEKAALHREIHTGSDARFHRISFTGRAAAIWMGHDKLLRLSGQSMEGARTILWCEAVAA